jgi:hypothetical protein
MGAAFARGSAARIVTLSTEPTADPQAPDLQRVGSKNLAGNRAVHDNDPRLASFVAPSPEQVTFGMQHRDVGLYLPAGASAHRGWSHGRGASKETTMRSRHKVALGAAGALSMIALTLPTASVASAAASLDAHMRATAAFPRVHGLAESYRGGGDFELVIYHAQRIAGKRVAVRVHGLLVGRARVHADGTAYLDRHHGLPTMRAGDIVRVRAPSGTLVSVGTLHLS